MFNKTIKTKADLEMKKTIQQQGDYYGKNKEYIVQ
jgi:hypothetical protein